MSEVQLRASHGDYAKPSMDAAEARAYARALWGPYTYVAYNEISDKPYEVSGVDSAGGRYFGSSAVSYDDAFAVAVEAGAALVPTKDEIDAAAREDNAI